MWSTTRVGMMSERVRKAVPWGTYRTSPLARVSARGSYREVGSPAFRRAFRPSPALLTAPVPSASAGLCPHRRIRRGRATDGGRGAEPQADQGGRAPTALHPHGARQGRGQGCLDLVRYSLLAGSQNELFAKRAPPGYYGYVSAGMSALFISRSSRRRSRRDGRVAARTSPSAAGRPRPRARASGASPRPSRPRTRSTSSTRRPPRRKPCTMRLSR